MTDRPSSHSRSTQAATGEVSALQTAEDREHAAPPKTAGAIAAWVNEGGAGGEVKR
jgi:hypothetical protein